MKHSEHVVDYHHRLFACFLAGDPAVFINDAQADLASRVSSIAALLKNRREIWHEVERLRDEVNTLISFIPRWARQVPSDLPPTMYGTGTEQGDRAVKKKVDAIIARQTGGEG